jgi:tetratricopeptide (TPR) repeat protein
LVRAIVNRYQEAMADCNESLRLRPGDGNTLGTRGLVYLKLKKLDLALADYDTALQADPKDAFSLYGRSIAKRLNGDEAGANVDIAAAKRISPDIAEDFERYGVRAP